MKRPTTRISDESSITLRNRSVREAAETSIKALQGITDQQASIAGAVKMLALDIGQPISLEVFFQKIDMLRSIAEPQLAPELNIQLDTILNDCVTKTREAAKTLLDGKSPIVFNRIIQQELGEYPKSPWYVVDFEYDVPAHGTTEASHHVLIRTRKPLARPGEDLTFDLLKEEFKGETPFTRIHSSCRDGDVPVPTARCDCGIQYKSAINSIEARGQGLLIYLNQDGRGFGDLAKSKALELEDGRDKGTWIGEIDPDTALRRRHGSADTRDFTVAAKVLYRLGVEHISLHTNNVSKIGGLYKNGIEVEQISSAGEATNDVLLVEHLTKIRSGMYPEMSYKAIRAQTEKRLGTIDTDKPINAALLHLFKQIVGDIGKEEIDQYPEELIRIITEHREEILRARSNGNGH